MTFKHFSYLLFVSIFLIACRGPKGPSNKQFDAKKRPSEIISDDYKKNLKIFDKSDKKRIKKEARERSKRFRKFKNNNIR